MVVPLILAAALLQPSLVQPEGTPPPSAPERAAASEPARWNWRKGDSGRYVVTQSVEVTAEGMLEYELSQTQTQRVLVEVEEVSAGGDATLKLTLEAIHITTVASEGAPPVVVSSHAKPTNEEFDPSGPCRAMVGLTLSIVVGADGVLREIRGLPALKDRVKAILAAPTLSNLATEVLASLDEIQLRTRIEPALLLEPKEPRAQPSPITFRGLGTLLADQSSASSSNDGRVTIHRTTDYTLRSPNTDEIAGQFEVSLSEGREECETTLEPSAGVVRKVESSLKLTSVLTPRKAAQGMVKTTRRLSQTLTIEPATDEKPVTPPEATERP